MSDSKSSTSSNFILFMLLAFGVVAANAYFFGNRQPPEKPKAAAKAEAGKQEGEAKKPEPGKEDGAAAKKAAEAEKPAEKPGRATRAEAAGRSRESRPRPRPRPDPSPR